MTDKNYYTVGLQKYMELQLLEIDEHKYYMSEKLGYDVGYGVATLSFISEGYAKKFRDNFVKNHRTIEELNRMNQLEIICTEHDCNKLHAILKDIGDN